MEHAALKAAELGANTFQIFSASPRMWKANRPDPAGVRRLQRAREKHDLYPLVIHVNYLINLASCSPALRRQSIEAFRGEIERALILGAEYLVAHPGSCKGYSREEGILTVAVSLAEAARGLGASKLTILLENTAGAGETLGGRPDDLQLIREHASRLSDLRIGYCVDTCHAFVAGSDAISFVLELGSEHVPVIHANDSKGALGSRLDRHANIGQGYIGEKGFRRILNHPEFRTKAFILETPVDEEGDDTRNVEKLKSLCRKSRTTRKLSN